MTLKDLSARLHDGSITPGAAVETALAAVADIEGELKAWVVVDASGARASARLLEDSTASRGPLWGVPVGIKDLIDVGGLPTRCGTNLRGNAPAEADAECVQLLRKAGAVIVGKTVTTEFGYFKPGPTRNPANTAHSPGGSSSGSAAAVGARTIPLALGTQTAGSLTRPASYCGAAGFVTARGSFSLVGVAGLSHSLDSLGFLCQSVSDLRYVWDALRDLSQPTLTPAHDEPFRPLLWDGAELGEVSEDMSAALEQAAASVPDGVVQWSDGELVVGLAEAHATVMAYEAARERAAELPYLKQLSAPFADLLTAGLNIPEDEYTVALETISAGRYKVLTLLESFGAILGPAALGAAPKFVDGTGTPVLSRPWQALGLPVITIPGLHDRSGMPLGLQLIGRPGDEDRLFSMAIDLEAALAPSPIPAFPNP